MCDPDFTVRFFNPAIGQLIDRAQAILDAPGGLNGMTILKALGVDDDGAITDIVARGAWHGVVRADIAGELPQQRHLHIAVESFPDAGSAAGWLITAREHRDQAAPAPASDRDLIILSDKLTPREREVVLALQEGASNKAIALRLDISPRTVEFHRARIMQRFAAKSVIDLVRKIARDVQAQPG